MKKRISIFLAICMVCTLFYGYNPNPLNGVLSGTTVFGAAVSNNYTSGTYEGSGTGFGGAIKVTVEISGDAIKSVVVTENKETAGIGSRAIEQMPETFVKNNSAEIDSISGCTVTSNGMKEAVQNALNKASGKEISTEVSLANGTYTATVTSYSETNGLPDGNGKLTLTVTTANNKITNIEILEYTDTSVIGGMAFPQLAESIIATQSLGIDAVSGATVSSGAFLSAVSDCIAQAGGNAAAMKARAVEVRPAKTTAYETDILVIGAGMAGLTAAIQAASEGAKVILLEKNEVLSSSTTRSLGFVVGADTDVQKAAGIYDTAEALYNDMYSLYKDEAALDTNLLKIATDKSSSLISFLTDNGVIFDGVKNVSPKEPRATKRTHVTNGGGAGLSTVLLSKAEELGVTILMGTPATGLVKDKNAVAGCKATNKYGDDISIQASSVIMCAGSYTNNTELLNKLNPRINNAEYVCGSGDGDAYLMFTEVGADIVDIAYPQLMYYFYSPTWPSCPAVLPGSPDNNVGDQLLVDGGGRRVASEDDFCFEFIKQVWDGGYNEGYCVVGKAFAEKYPDTIEMGLSSTVSASGLPFGYTADSISELAENVGIDPAVLTATVNRYNELCDKGVDEDFKKGAEYMVKIEAPYYILRLPQIATDGYTGARINENSQVIDTDGNVISGLYAAGSCAVGQMTGVNYFGCGSSLFLGGVYGRIAASDAVAKLAK